MDRHSANEHRLTHGAHQLSNRNGAKAAFIPVDEVLDHLHPRVEGKLEMMAPDADAHAQYEKLILLDASRELAQPQVACPHAVDEVQPLSALGDHAGLGSA
jgi:homoaconitase/3-isopropylmalate dehydratase large subunit